jgi:hypothetical protein
MGSALVSSPLALLFHVLDFFLDSFYSFSAFCT